MLAVCAFQFQIAAKIPVGNSVTGCPLRAKNIYVLSVEHFVAQVRIFYGHRDFRDFSLVQRIYGAFRL